VMILGLSSPLASGWSRRPRGSLGYDGYDASRDERPPEGTALTRRPTPPPSQTRKERRQADRDSRRQREVQKSSKPAWQSPVVLVTTGAIVIAVLLIGAAVVTQGGGSNPTAGTIVAPAEAIPAGIPVDGTTMGKADAPVTLTVYSDFQCPGCDLFATQTEPRLRSTYVAQGTLKIVYHDAAFQGQKSTSSWDESVEPAAGARCAGEQGLFWEFHDWLFANQQGENQGGFSQDRLNQIAQKVPGLDFTKWQACMATGTQQAIVKQQTQETQTLGIDSTPTLDINGKRIVGAAPYDQIAPVIDAAAASAAPSGSSPAASGASPSAAGTSPSPSGVSPSP
jgi:protein-disulfide isomerase